VIHSTILLHLDKQTYPIYIGQNVFASVDVLARHIHGKQVFIVTQEKLAELYLPHLQHALRGYHCDVFLLPEGEQYKNLDEWRSILDALLQAGHERSTTLIALGGGVVGDITGFAAACYQRGVNYIQIPTTLIAQVDAAIGGKTAVNHPRGKNMVGVFYQPQCVIVDIDLLQTLSPREYLAALAEVIKYGLIGDSEFFGWLELHQEDLLARKTDVLLHAIQVGVSMKAQIVSEDERDMERRNLLNFGHSFGHALEVWGGYQEFLHGEAVAIGMVMATMLSGDLGLISAVVVTRIINFVQALGFRMNITLPSSTELIQLMQRDKKVQQGKLNLILLTDLGSAEKIATVNEMQIEQMLQKFISRFYH
jgi:3-dehydroquinate synthase